MWSYIVSKQLQLLVAVAVAVVVAVMVATSLPPSDSRMRTQIFCFLALTLLLFGSVQRLVFFFYLSFFFDLWFFCFFCFAQLQLYTHWNSHMWHERPPSGCCGKVSWQESAMLEFCWEILCQYSCCQ